MRILKYLFLLFLLSLVAFSIFIATLKGAFSVEKSILIDSQKTIVFDYVKDLKNWREWNSMAVEDTNVVIGYSTSGYTNTIHWEGKEGSGEWITTQTHAKDSINQIMRFNGNSADISIRFKDSIGKTKVSIQAKGRMSFLMKIKNILNGGANSIFGRIFEKSLVNLDKKLDYEVNTYNLTVNGVVKKLETFYLAETFTSEFSKVTKNAEIMFAKINTFCTDNNLDPNGKPFIIYHTFDSVRKLTKLSFCIPLKESFQIAEKNKIKLDTLNAFEAVKTTLRGNYSHMNKAYSRTSDFFKKNNLRNDPVFSHLEIYSIGKNEINNPSKWKTEIYFPIKSKPIYKPKSTEVNETDLILPNTEEEEKNNDIQTEF